MEPPTKISSVLSDKWIATVAWVALLFALVYTSGEIATISITTNIYGTFFPDDNLTISLLALVLFCAMLVAIVIAWLKYVALSTELYLYFADLTETENVFELITDFIEVEDGEEAKGTTYEQADKTAISDVIQWLGIAWALSMIAPVVLSVVARSMQ